MKLINKFWILIEFTVLENKDEADADAKTTRSLKRSCELWSLEDKNTFFKAINEYGKDFDALQTYFLIQGKKKGVEEKLIKNKEQIRHFYYRTWLKISKHLKFSEGLNFYSVLFFTYHKNLKQNFCQ